MNFSINLDFFLDNITNELDKELIINHHNIINKHIECANKYILIKKELLELYQQYNNQHKSELFISSISDYINNLKNSISNLENDGINQKDFFQKKYILFV